MLLVLKICNNESGGKMPISDNVSYSVTMHTQKNRSHAEYDGTIHLATLNAYQVDKYLYIFLKSRKA
jgi:hypothetical protein